MWLEPKQSRIHCFDPIVSHKSRDIDLQFPLCSFRISAFTFSEKPTFPSTTVSSDWRWRRNQAWFLKKNATTAKVSSAPANWSHLVPGKRATRTGGCLTSGVAKYHVYGAAFLACGTAFCHTAQLTPFAPILRCQKTQFLKPVIGIRSHASVTSIILLQTIKTSVLDTLTVKREGAPGGSLHTCARDMQGATWRSLTTRSLLLCWRHLYHGALRRCTSWRGCAPSAWVLSKAGVRSTGGRQWHQLPAGWSCTLMGPCSGWTACSPRWAPPECPAVPCPEGLSCAQADANGALAKGNCQCMVASSPLRRAGCCGVGSRVRIMLILHYFLFVFFLLEEMLFDGSHFHFSLSRFGI